MRAPSVIENETFIIIVYLIENEFFNIIFITDEQSHGLFKIFLNK